ncbi:MAG: flagellar motor switch protein FliG [Paracoccaceae bacterium]
MNNLTPLAQLPSPGASGGKGRLTRKQKAAIIVRLLLNEGAEVRLKDLPEDMQISLTQQLGAMRHITRDVLAGVISEFADELDGMGLTFPRDLAGALDQLDGKISPHTAARLRKEAGVRQYGDPWERIKGLGVEALLPIVENESTEVAAVMLAKIDVSKAAELLGRLPGAKARRITYAVSLTGAVTPDAVDRIGLSLAAQLDAQPERAFSDGPVERVGAILNFSPAATRDDVLEGLDEEDQVFADQVRKAIFTFANIYQRLAPRDIPKVIREIDQAALVTALAAASGLGGDMAKSAEFVLENMSKRMADSLREEIEGAGKIKTKDGEEAMTEVINAIREMEAKGEVLLIAGDEDEEA